MLSFPLPALLAALIGTRSLTARRLERAEPPGSASGSFCYTVNLPARVALYPRWLVSLVDLTSFLMATEVVTVQDASLSWDD